MKASTHIEIIMGSSSDAPVMQEAKKILSELGIPAQMTVVSAHRTPARMMQYAKEAKKRGVKIIIAGAGGAAHLPGMVASITTLPVIGVPMLSSNSIAGVDSLLSIVQMPGGVPVATVGVNNAKNAGLLAARMMAVEDDAVSEKLETYQKAQEEKVLKSAENMENESSL